MYEKTKEEIVKVTDLNEIMKFGVMLILALAVDGDVKVVGIILTVAMLITPGCIAYLLRDRFDRMLWIAAGSSMFSSVGGTYASYFLNGSTGACIVLTQSLENFTWKPDAYEHLGKRGDVVNKERNK